MLHYVLFLRKKLKNKLLLLSAIFSFKFSTKGRESKIRCETHTHTPCTNVKVLPLSNENHMVLSKLECSLRPYTIVSWPFQHMFVK